jgi:copper oxidase (laccase) domain-containing protein
MLDEHHGVTVREVEWPGEHDLATGDVLVTSIDGAVLGCWVGDCAPVVMIGRQGRIGVAHAGWRGLAGGVLDVAADAVAEPLDAVVLGPVIGPCCYEFGADDLALVAAGIGESVAGVAGTTSVGALALDVPTAVAAFARRLDVPLSVLGGCTGCAYPGFSHRVRRDRERHVVAVWQEVRP